MRVRSLGWDESLEEGTATHSSILAWRILWTEEPDRPQSMGIKVLKSGSGSFFFRDNQEWWWLTSPLKMAVPLLSVCPLPDQCLLHLHLLWPSYILALGAS